MPQFRVTRGVHIEEGPPGPPGPDGKPTRTDKYFRARLRGDPPDYTGDIVESNIDMAARFGPKFAPIFQQGPAQVVERVVEKVVTKFVPLDFEVATVEELRQYAEEEEIDLNGARDRGQVLKIIRDTRKARATK